MAVQQVPNFSSTKILERSLAAQKSPKILLTWIFRKHFTKLADFLEKIGSGKNNFGKNDFGETDFWKNIFARTDFGKSIWPDFLSVLTIFSSKKMSKKVEKNRNFHGFRVFFFEIFEFFCYFHDEWRTTSQNACRPSHVLVMQSSWGEREKALRVPRAVNIGWRFTARMQVHESEV